MLYFPLPFLSACDEFRLVLTAVALPFPSAILPSPPHVFLCVFPPLGIGLASAFLLPFPSWFCLFLLARSLLVRSFCVSVCFSILFVCSPLLALRVVLATRFPDSLLRFGFVFDHCSFCIYELPSPRAPLYRRLPEPRSSAALRSPDVASCLACQNNLDPSLPLPRLAPRALTAIVS